MMLDTEKLTNQQIRLQMGELTADELQIAISAINWANRVADDEIKFWKSRSELDAAIIRDLENRLAFNKNFIRGLTLDFPGGGWLGISIGIFTTLFGLHFSGVCVIF